MPKKISGFSGANAMNFAAGLFFGISSLAEFSFGQNLPDFFEIPTGRITQSTIIRRRPIQDVAQQYKQDWKFDLDPSSYSETDDEVKLKIIQKEWLVNAIPPIAVTQNFAEADLAIYSLISSGDRDQIQTALKFASVAPPVWLFHIYNRSLPRAITSPKNLQAFAGELGQELASMILDTTIAVGDAQPSEVLALPLRHFHAGLGGTLGSFVAAQTSACLSMLVNSGVCDESMIRRLADERGAIAGMKPATKSLMEELARCLKPPPRTPPQILSTVPMLRHSNDDGTNSDPLRSIAAARLSMLHGFLQDFSDINGYYPASLDEVVVWVPEKSTNPSRATIVLDPMTGDTQRFIYESDGTSYTLRSSFEGDLSTRIDLMRKASRLFTPEEAAAGKRKHLEMNEIKRKAAAGEIGGLPKTDPEIFAKLQMIEALIWLHASAHGDRPPKDLAELMGGKPRYLNAIRDESQLPYVREALDAGKLVPPKGWEWHYEVSPDGKTYLLGLKNPETGALDTENAPLVSSKRRLGDYYVLPGEDAAETVRQFRAPAP